MTRLSKTLLFALMGLAGAAPLEADAATAPAAVSEVMNTALAERDSLPAAVGSLWRFEGPSNWIIGTHDYGLAPYSGRVNEIAVHPTNPKIMYLTGPTGGAWKTTDGGRTWAARSKGWPLQAATAVAIDPNNGNRVFVGTGDYKRLDHIEPFSVGIMRSLDGGLTWANFGSNEMREFTVSRIVVDPNGSTNVLAATGRGSRLPGGQIFRSTDGGAHWTNVVDTSGNPLPDANWDDLEISPGHVFWASATRRNNLDHLPDLHGSNGLLYASFNSGSTWTNINLTTATFSLSSALSRPDTIQIACDPDSTNVFVGVYENGLTRIFVTGNNGANWSELPGSTTASFRDCESTNLVAQYPVPTCGAPWAHAAFCATSNALYVAGNRIFVGQLVNGQYVFSSLSGDLPHDDYQCIVPDPTEADAVFLGTDAGIYRYSLRSGASVSLSTNLALAQIYRWMSTREMARSSLSWRRTWEPRSVFLTRGRMRRVSTARPPGPICWVVTPEAPRSGTIVARQSI